MNDVMISAHALGWLCGSLGFFLGFLSGLFVVLKAWATSDERKKGDGHV